MANIKYQQHKIANIKYSQARVKPDNSAWFEDANLKNLIVCQV